MAEPPVDRKAQVISNRAMKAQRRDFDRVSTDGHEASPGREVHSGDEQPILFLATTLSRAAQEKVAGQMLLSTVDGEMVTIIPTCRQSREVPLLDGRNSASGFTCN